MEYFWIVLGALLVVFTLTDTFFTVLNYDERGILVNRFVRAEWAFWRTVTSRMRGRSRRFAYRQMTGVLLVSIIILWVSGIVLGFALIFFGALGLDGLKASEPGLSDFWGALYVSIGQFSTVGADNFSPQQNWLGILAVGETLCSVVFLSMVITFTVNIYDAIQALRTFCATFPSSHAEVTSPIDELAPYFPSGDHMSLENHLSNMRSNLNGYFDSLAQDHPAYFFQSGNDRFAMPFGVFMVGGHLEGLYGGLPKSYPARHLAELSRLLDAFEGCQNQIYRRFHWKMPTQPQPLDPQAFAEQYQAMEVKNLPQVVKKDEYVVRFKALTTSMTTMAQIEVESNPADLYDRYCHWLRFVVNTDDFIHRASMNLGYRPAYLVGNYAFCPPLSYYGWTDSVVSKPIPDVPRALR